MVNLPFFKRLRKFKISLIFLIILLISNSSSILSRDNLRSNKKDLIRDNDEKYLKKSEIIFPRNKWENIKLEKKYQDKVIWEKLDEDQYLIQNKKSTDYSNLFKFDDYKLGSFNRSIVFNNFQVGPDINWLIPPGLAWNKKFKFDSSVRGHSRRKKGQSFLGWNGGDAVGQFYYQFLHHNKMSYGLNFGLRSVYSGSAAGGATAIGEGRSLGFRTDYAISPTAGFAFGAEQLLHFDGLTDTGRDIYLTISKAFWKKNLQGEFPLRIYTFGFGTGKMAEGNIKGLCSNLFGGSGTEINHQRKLCWAPVFSISSVYNKKFSTFFEYNSKFFLIGTSLVPFEKIPFRGTFAVQLSDHIDNYKLNSFDELKWVFRLSLGF